MIGSAAGVKGASWPLLWGLRPEAWLRVVAVSAVGESTICAPAAFRRSDRRLSGGLSEIKLTFLVTRGRLRSPRHYE